MGNLIRTGTGRSDTGSDMLSAALGLARRSLRHVPLTTMSVRSMTNAASSRNRRAIVELVQQIGSRKEVELYLRHFSALDSRKFAVIQVWREAGGYVTAWHGIHETRVAANAMFGNVAGRLGSGRARSGSHG